MQYKPILDAIKAILVADETANGLIAAYRFFMVEQGVYATPVCIIGSTTEMSHAQSYLGSVAGTRPRSWGISIGISILGRSYPTQTQLITEVENLDATQAAVYTALNTDTKIGDTVTQSLVRRVHNVALSGGEYVGGEYFGHEVIIEAEKKEG